MGVKVREKIRGSGLWWVFIHHQGRRRSIQAGSYEVAAEVATRLRIKLADDPDSLFREKQKPKPFFRAVAKQWLDVARDSCKESSVERYEQVYRDYIADALGGKRIDQIDRQAVSDILLNMRAQGLSQSTIDLARGCISGPMQQAIFQGLIQIDPTIGVMKQLRLTRSKKGSKNVKAMDEGQARDFLTSCQKHRPDFFELFAMLLGTGCRLGEALALTWSNVDFRTKTALINKSYRRQVSTTKTKKSREIALGDEVYQMLRRRKAAQMREAKGKASPLVFPGKDGGHIHQNSVRNVAGQIFKKAKLPTFRVHDLRHTFATLALRAGTPVQMVSKQLGHSSISITVDVYYTFMPNENQAFVSSLGQKLLGGNHAQINAVEIKKTS